MVEFGQLVLGVLPYYLGEAVRLYTTLEQSYSAHPDPPLSLSCHSLLEHLSIPMTGQT